MGRCSGEGRKQSEGSHNGVVMAIGISDTRIIDKALKLVSERACAI